MLYNPDLIEAVQFLKQKVKRAAESAERADAEELAADSKALRSGYRRAADHDAYMLRAAAIDFVREWEDARMPQLHELLGRRTNTQPAASAVGV